MQREHRSLCLQAPHRQDTWCGCMLQLMRLQSTTGKENNASPAGPKAEAIKTSLKFIMRQCSVRPIITLTGRLSPGSIK